MRTGRTNDSSANVEMRRDEYERGPRTARDYAQEFALQLIQGPTEPEVVTDAFEEVGLV